MPRAVASNSLFYADYICIVFQHKIVIEIQKQLDFSGLCDWFVDNKLSIHFGKDKTKSILFGTKHKLRNAKSLNIVCNGKEIYFCLLLFIYFGFLSSINLMEKNNYKLTIKFY